MLFEWDENKRKANLAKHQIDFRDVRGIFQGPVFEKTDSRSGEDRILAIGLMEGIAIVVVYVMRVERRRIISARRANRDERYDYQDHLEATGKRPE